MITFAVLGSDSNYPFEDDYYESDGLEKADQDKEYIAEREASTDPFAIGLDVDLAEQAEREGGIGKGPKGAEKQEEAALLAELEGPDLDPQQSVDLEELAEARQQFFDVRERQEQERAGAKGETKEATSLEGTTEDARQSAAKDVIKEPSLSELEARYVDAHTKLYGIPPRELTQTGADLDRPWAIENVNATLLESDRPKAGDERVVLRADVPRMWMGTGAEILGLSGKPTVEARQELMAGRVEGQQVGQQRHGEIVHRRGWDLVFTSPKSVSLMAALGTAEEKAGIKESAFEATKQVIAIIEERHAGSRVRTQDGIAFQKSGNLVAASFMHMGSRDADPHMHIHANIMNVTKQADGSWRSVTIDHALHDIKSLGQLYKTFLSEQLEEKGWALERSTNGVDFEIKGIERSTIDAFSTANSRVLGQMRANQRTTWLENKITNDQSRPNKKTLTVEQRDKNWQAAKEKLGITFPNARSPEQRAVDGKQIKSVLISELPKQSVYLARIDPKDKERPTNKIAAMAVSASLHNLDSAKTLITRTELEAKAVARAQGAASYRQITNAVEQMVLKSILVQAHKAGPDSFATITILRQEKALNAANLYGKDRAKPTMPLTKATASIEAASARNKEKHGFELSPDQKKVLEVALTTKDRAMIVIGAAGTGKTSTFVALDSILGSNCQRQVNARGLSPNQNYGTRKLILLVPTHKLKNEALKSALDARTAASFIQYTREIWREGGKGPSPSQIERLSKGTLVVDEASLRGTSDQAKITLAAQRLGMKVIWTGDREQREAVVHGSAFAQSMQTLHTSKLTEVFRVASKEDKSMFEAARAGDYKALIKTLGDRAIDTKDGIESFREIYAKHIETGLDKVIVPVTTNDGRRAMNQLMRDVHLEKDKLGAEQGTFGVYYSKRENEADRSVAGNYKVGDKVIVTSNTGFNVGKTNLARYQELTVEKIDAKANKLTLSSGNASIVVNPATRNFAGKTDTFVSATRELRTGERIVWEVTDDKRGIYTGSEATLTDKRNGLYVFQEANGTKTFVHEKDPVMKRWDYGYGATTDRAQGQTASGGVTILMDTSTGTAKMNKSQFYVALTRIGSKLASEEANIKIIGDNIEKRISDALANKSYAKSALGSITPSQVDQKQLDRHLKKTPDYRYRSTLDIVKDIKSALAKPFATSEPERKKEAEQNASQAQSGRNPDKVLTRPMVRDQSFKEREMDRNMSSGRKKQKDAPDLPSL